jgi:hypothetical protein
MWRISIWFIVATFLGLLHPRQRLRRLSCVVAVVAWFLLSPVAKAETVSLYPVSDRSAEDRPNVNTGALYDGVYDTLFEDDDQYLNTFQSLGRWEIRAALEFDMHTIPADARIVSAGLFLQTTGLGAHTFPTLLQVEGYSGNGIIDLPDFSAANLIGVAELPTPGELRPVLIDTTSFIQSLDAVGGRFPGFVLRAVPGAHISVASSETTYTSLPRLDIQYETVGVPEPSMIRLTAVGTFLFAAFYTIRVLFRR